jgi:hypothetical protein
LAVDAEPEVIQETNFAVLNNHRKQRNDYQILLSNQPFSMNLKTIPINDWSCSTLSTDDTWTCS